MDAIIIVNKSLTNTLTEKDLDCRKEALIQLINTIINTGKLDQLELLIICKREMSDYMVKAAAHLGNIEALSLLKDNNVKMSKKALRNIAKENLDYKLLKWIEASFIVSASL